MPRLAIVHTSFALVEMLGALAREMLPQTTVVNIVDDTLLADAREHGVDESLTRRICRYFQGAEEAGADVILNACSTVGEPVDAARRQIRVPILKIDEPMAEAAVATGRRIAVLATVSSTLGPTCRLLEAKAREAGTTVELTPKLCEGAFELLQSGRAAEHDQRVTDAVRDAERDHDVIVFAQASMSRLVPDLEGRVGRPLLASPRLAMQRVAGLLSQADGR
jgi:Asp/Glu/hydantoin racemase